MEKIHILGVCGTFMGSLALLAQELGFSVLGYDDNAYPPMSTMLAQQQVNILPFKDAQMIESGTVIVGNAMKRGHPVIEALLDRHYPLYSGPEWLARHVLQGKTVIAVSGTHGKTTTSSMVAWILQYSGLEPGFLIGGVPQNFGVSARLGNPRYFVIEADEYDTAFFDKRAKFLHFWPSTLIINNIEYDHADIFPDLAAIQTQFHHLVRTVSSQGHIITPSADPQVEQVVNKGCWSQRHTIGLNCGAWQGVLINSDGSAFDVIFQNRKVGVVTWSLMGEHNVLNALAAIAAAHTVGIDPATSIAALAQFQNVKRRLEKIAEINGISIYDDFAHHPTAITMTLKALRAHRPHKRIIAVLECRSNTMKMGIHKNTLAPALCVADHCFILRPTPDWGIESLFMGVSATIRDTVTDLIHAIGHYVKPDDQILIMSNGGFDNIYSLLPAALSTKKKEVI